jgi:hypothetical protein
MCSLNSRNKSAANGVKYEYLNELPEHYESFTEYRMASGEVRHFNNLFIKVEHNKPEFITFNSEHQYRPLYENVNKTGCHYVCHRDINNKRCAICFNRISKAQTKISQTQATIAETQKQIAETENNLSKALLNMTEIIKAQQTQQIHQEETSDEEYEHREPEEDYSK